MQDKTLSDAVAWQTGVWDKISELYWQVIDQRLVPVVDVLVQYAALQPGEAVLDLGTGTGAVARRAAALVGPHGEVTGTDISPAMLEVARRLSRAPGSPDIAFAQCRAEELTLEDASVDVVLANLVLMYVIDRALAAREIARVLKPGGRIVAAVWAGPEQCDIVRFQQTAGKFAPPPPVKGVGPGALANPAEMLQYLDEAGIRARVEAHLLGFDFPDFASAWTTLAGVTTAHLPAQLQQQAKDAVAGLMYPNGDGPRHFDNLTQFIVGRREA